MVNIGSNKFENVAFPLAFEDRYFMLETNEGNDLWTVFTVQNEKAIVEILKNIPQENEFTETETNSTGIITVSKDGVFLYKIRPGSKNSSIFGKINGEETEMKITDREIRIGTNTFQRNTVIGFGVGIIVNKNGIGMGAPLPTKIKDIVQQASKKMIKISNITSSYIK